MGKLIFFFFNILVLLHYLLQEVLGTFPWLKILYSFQKGIFYLMPHIGLFNGQLSFFIIALQNARCRRLPNRLQEVVCMGIPDICCGTNALIILINFLS